MVEELMDAQFGEVLRKWDEISHGDDYSLEAIVEDLFRGIHIGFWVIFCEGELSTMAYSW
jgi:hypothetical protein